MKLSSLVCCDTVVQDANNKQNLVAPIQTIKLINLPSAYSFSITVGLVDINKIGGELISVILKNEKGEKINGLENIKLPPSPPELDKKEPYGLFMNFDIRNMIFVETGLYWVEVINQDSSLGTIFFEVFI